MFSTPSSFEVRDTLRDLPDDITIVDDAADGSTWVVYDDHLIAAWDPTEDTSRVRLHLREIDQDLVAVELDQLTGALRYLQAAGYRMAGSHTVPPQDDGDGIMKILIFEAHAVGPETLREAIYWTLSASSQALDPRL